NRDDRTNYKGYSDPGSAYDRGPRQGRICDTLPPTSNTTAQSNEYLDPKLPETSVESTKPNDPEWLQPDEFTTMVYKQSKASRK
ncbi:31646_t:CDS:2, partial [Gigaspora margarita]